MQGIQTKSQSPLARGKSGLFALLSLFAVIAIVLSWLVFPLALNGRDLMTNAGSQLQDDRQGHAKTLSQFLSRPTLFPGGIEVTSLWATEEYFAQTDRASVTDYYDPENNFVFFITENVHTGMLPEGLPEAFLSVGDTLLRPTLIEGPSEASHHRLTAVTFPKFDETGAPYATDTTAHVRLRLNHAWDRFYEIDGIPQPVISRYQWDLPLDIPTDLLIRPGLSAAMVLSLSAGLLAAVLTPCLLQLAVVFMATMGASGAEAVATRGKVDDVAKNRILVAASAFVIGYFILFTTAGALIGGLGKQAQIAFSMWSRPVAIGSGILVIFFGLWLGIRSNAPLLCRLPGAKLMQRLKGGSTFGNVMIAIVYNLGCMSCFGGAIIATLFVYVGALGSAFTGAVTMGGFALGLGIPFMVAALFFSRVEPLILAVAKYHRPIGLVSSLIVMGFGVLLITDNFHTLSDAIYPYLGLGGYR